MIWQVTSCLAAPRGKTDINRARAYALGDELHTVLAAQLGHDPEPIAQIALLAFVADPQLAGAKWF